MCNPPFYTDANELYKSAREKQLEPFSVPNSSDMNLTILVMYRISRGNVYTGGRSRVYNSNDRGKYDIKRSNPMVFLDVGQIIQCVDPSPGSTRKEGALSYEI